VAQAIEAELVTGLVPETAVELESVIDRAEAVED
jgi:hypothetical protein